ncbi:hypothetical protein [Sinorhizobium fredii]|nr:hypothetical protein [Sinorhizobium fredii]
MPAPKIALVKPAAALLGKDARHTLAVEVDPLIRAAVEAFWQIGEILPG